VSLHVATRTGAAKPADFAKVIVDTPVQPKSVAFPTDAKLMHRARERLARLAKKHGVALCQSYERVGKYALIGHQPASKSDFTRRSPPKTSIECPRPSRCLPEVLVVEPFAAIHMRKF
jgi:IS5 family transposase